MLPQCSLRERGRGELLWIAEIQQDNVQMLRWRGRLGIGDARRLLCHGFINAATREPRLDGHLS